MSTAPTQTPTQTPEISDSKMWYCCMLLSIAIIGKRIKTKPHPTDKLWYTCLNGGIVEIDPLYWYESGHVRAQLLSIEEDEDDDDDEGEMSVWQNYMDDENKFGHDPIYVQMRREVLELVDTFCVSRFKVIRNCHERGMSNDEMQNDLNNFDQDFVKGKGLILLVELMDAAVEMEIKSLLTITHHTIVDKLKKQGVNKASSKLSKIFNVPGF